MAVTNVAQQCAEVGIEKAAESAARQMNATAQDVRQAARNLVNYVDEIVAKNNANRAMAQSMNTSTDIEAVYGFSKKLVKTHQEFLDLMRLVFDFQNKANAFLGQKVQMTFVYIHPRTGNVEVYHMDNSVDDVSVSKRASSRGGGYAGRYKYKQVLGSGAVLVDTSQAKETGLEDTFQEVYERYKMSKFKMKLGGAAYILWYENGWDGAWISGAGPLGEAYFNFFINEYKFSGMIDPRVKDFMLNDKYGAVKADNASGFLQGDVSKDGIEYGIKINNGPTLGYMNIIDYARDLLEASDPHTFLENLKSTLSGKAKSNMVKHLEKNISEVSQELITDMAKRIGLKVTTS